MKPTKYFGRSSALPLGLAVGLVLVLGNRAQAQDQTFPGTAAPPPVRQAATNGLLPFLSRIPAETMESYGFPNGANLDQACLGEPVLLHRIAPAAVLSNTNRPSVRSLVSPTRMWFFPVMLGTETKAMLVVDQVGDRWEAVSLGYATLAREMNQIWNHWPASKAFHPQIIAAFQAKEYLLLRS